MSRRVSTCSSRPQRARCRWAAGPDAA
jgi:hypothetical protein